MEDKSRLDRIEERQEEIINLMAGVKVAKKPKEFKIPSSARVNKQKAKQNYVTIIKLNENRNLDFTKVPIIEQTVMVDGVPRLASGEYILNYKNQPFMILPNWSVVPFSPSDHFEKSLKDGSNSVGYRIILNRMKLEAIKLGKKVSNWILILGGLVVGAIIIYALWKG